MQIFQPSTPEQLEMFRGLLREWFDFLVNDCDIDMGYQSIEAELAGLPGSFGPPKGRMWLACDDAGVAVGCVALRPMPDEGVCELKRLYVKPVCRGKGVGRVLAAQAIDEARAMGYRLMRLDTGTFLEASRRLYASLGFVETGPYYDVPPDVLRVTVFMELPLTIGPADRFSREARDVDAGLTTTGAAAQPSEGHAVQHEEGRFAGAGGLELYWQCWRPSSEPRAVVALVHGVGEHSGRYMNLVGPLVDDGYAVYGYDQRGHGRSPGPRVHIDRWADYRDDLGAYLGMVAQQAPGRAIVIYGHSMGTLVVLDYLLQRPGGLAGAIVSGVALQPAGVGKPYQVAMARVLSRVAPRLSVDLGIDGGSLTRDPQVLEAARADPHLTSRATVRWGAESLATVRRVRQGLATIDLPLLVLHGGADPLNRPAGAQALFETVSSPDKTLHIYPGVRHEPHNDLGHEQVAADVKEWLAHLTS